MVLVISKEAPIPLFLERHKQEGEEEEGDERAKGNAALAFECEESLD